MDDADWHVSGALDGVPGQLVVDHEEY